MLRILVHTEPFGAKASLAFFLLRLIAGVAFMFHGWGKIQAPFSWMGPESSMPGILQALAAISEFGGGLAWVIGLLTPLASFGIVCTMTVAVFTHVSRGDPFVGKGGSYELALVYLAIGVLLLLLGAGRYSADHMIAGQKKVGSSTGDRAS